MQYHSKEELELYIKELKATIKDLEDAFNNFTKDSEHKSGEIFTKFQEELKKVKEGLAKLEKLKDNYDI